MAKDTERLIMDIEDYISYLMKLDWFYEMSDDYSVWSRGEHTMKIAVHMASKSPAHRYAFEAVKEYRTNSTLSVGDAATKFRTEIDKARSMK